MALDTLANLTTEVSDWLNRQDLTAKIPTFIRLIEAQVERTQRTWQMVTRAYAKTFVSADGVTFSDYLPLPGDYLQLVRARITDAPIAQFPLSYASMSELDKIQTDHSTPTTPTDYNIVGGALRLAPIPDRVYTVEIVYYAKMPKLSSSNTRNWLLTDHPDIYLYGALSKAAPYLKDDDRVPVWQSELTTMLEDLRISNERGERSGQPVRARLGRAYG